VAAQPVGRRAELRQVVLPDQALDVHVFEQVRNHRNVSRSGPALRHSPGTAVSLNQRCNLRANIISNNINILTQMAALSGGKSCRRCGSFPPPKRRNYPQGVFYHAQIFLAEYQSLDA
jgi:hypothetical protein